MCVVLFGGACMVLFGGACMVLFGGHAWFYSGGGMRGFIRGGGACVVLFGGHAWFYLGGVWFYSGGHAWFYSGGMHGFIREGVCVVLFGGGMRGFIWGCAWFYFGGGVHGFSSFFGYNEIWSMSGRYASYWNAFLFALFSWYCRHIWIQCNALVLPGLVSGLQLKVLICILRAVVSWHYKVMLSRTYSVRQLPCDLHH